jgi:hypothetical protein
MASAPAQSQIDSAIRAENEPVTADATIVRLDVE